MPTSPELLEALADLKRHLAWQQSEGVASLLVSADSLRADRAPAPGGNVARSAAPQAQRTAAPATPPAAKPAATSKQTAKAAGALKSFSDLTPVTAYTDADRRPLDEIRRELGDCKRCKLCSGRKQIVFGVGNPRAELVFVGEGPGAEEDAQGVPFVGPAGQLLTKMIEAMGFSRDEVYICNVVKCRPPDNRAPELEEIVACEPFLRQQLGAIQPKVIVGLGKTAVQSLLRRELSITSVRGQWQEYAGIQLMPTFHPSYLLRRPEEKKVVWSDLQQVMKVFRKQPKKA